MTSALDNQPFLKTGRDELVQAIHEKTGFTIGSEKDYLLETRLIDLFRSVGLPSYLEASKKLRDPGQREFAEHVVDLIATHETSFFRDGAVFHAITEQIIPEWLERKRVAGQVMPTLRIWSAGCSTGQEPYSLGIQIRERYPDLWLRTEVLATDFAKTTLAKAAEGAFTNFELDRGMPVHFRVKYFTQEGSLSRIKPEIRSRISFAAHNLVSDPFPKGYDIVLCRNVVIYFAEDIKKTVYQKLTESLTTDGALILGSAESLSGYVTSYVLRRYTTMHYYEPSSGNITLFKPLKGPAS